MTCCASSSWLRGPSMTGVSLSQTFTRLLLSTQPLQPCSKWQTLQRCLGGVTRKRSAVGACGVYMSQDTAHTVHTLIENLTSQQQMLPPRHHNNKCCPLDLLLFLDPFHSRHHSKTCPLLLLLYTHHTFLEHTGLWLAERS